MKIAKWGMGKCERLYSNLIYRDNTYELQCGSYIYKGWFGRIKRCKK